MRNDNIQRARVIVVALLAVAVLSPVAAGADIMLENAQTRGGLSGVIGKKSDFFFIDVPPGATQLEVVTWGGFGDADLFLRYGAKPAPFTTDYVSNLKGHNNERILVNNPTAGRWWIVVGPGMAYALANLRATFTNAPFPGGGGGGNGGPGGNLVPVYLQVMAPQPGATWKAGKTYTISWLAPPGVTTVRIQFQKPGVKWNNVAVVAAATGKYHWKVPDHAYFDTKHARIRVVDHQNPGKASQPVGFRIFRSAVAPPSPNVQMISPKGGQTYAMGQTVPLIWQASPSVAKIRLEYSLNNGATWTYLGYAIASKKKATWTIPNHSAFKTNHARFRMTDFTDPADGMTTGAFRIVSSNQAQPTTALKILAPTQNLTLPTGKSYPIKLQKPPGSTNVAIQVIWVQGQPWQTVGTTIGKYFAWNIPYAQTFATAGVYIRAINVANPAQTSPPVRVRLFRPAVKP